MAVEKFEALEQETASGLALGTDIEHLPSSEPSGPPSTFEKLCGTYISNTDRSRTFVNRLAYEMDRDERVRKICRVKLRQNKCELTDFDEVMQRTLEVFFGSMLAKIEDQDAVYAVVYAVAHNVSREVLRDRQKLLINHRSIEDMQEKGEELEQVGFADQVEVDHDRDIDTEAATIKMAAALKRVINGEQTVASSGIYAMDQDPMVRLVQPKPSDEEHETDTTSQTKPADASTKRPRGGSRAELSADQQELVKIGSDLGLRNQDYAFALGIGLPRLSSYIYGRTASVPDEVMEKARGLLAEEPHRRERLKRFDRDMSVILTDWMKRLGTNDDEDMGTTLGVTKMTIYRWRNNETKPDATALARYEQRIDYEIRMRKAVEQRLQGKRS
ncbi:hypothetical protein LU683_22620 [Pseudomonas asiatica]|uniref:hypothetical protein n=1 Tax=Pseudomonas TaxID=286 RepID=UPI0006D4964A|nr:MULTISPECIES: hypothetical protein [Pseudomonas]MCE0755678.1 hypothetical protein [Pseudomonas asiatica]MCE0982022.1 hypothetical protein [Pseudomonas monteilii]